MNSALIVATALCKRFEGMYLKPYLCPGGFWTIGLGTVNKPDGTRVTENHPPITKETAEAWLQHQLQTECLPAAVRMTPNLVGNEEAIGAIADFIYNLGASRYKTSTLRRRLQAGEWDEAQYEIRRWTRAGGRVLRGLQLRREAEAQYLQTPAL
jgi:lysozyme